MNDAIPGPQAKTRKALTPLLEIRNLTKSSMVNMRWMMQPDYLQR